VPDPFVLALLLTLAVACGGLLATGFDLERVSRVWVEGRQGAGFWAFLRFGMQMCLILVTGYALASSPPIARVLRVLARAPTGPRSAVAVVAIVSLAASLLNWGLGLIVGALLAREVGISARERGIDAHYPLLAAAGYAGLVAWHGGVSGSAPTKVTLESDQIALLGETLAARVGTIGLERTIGAPANLIVALSLLVVVPLTLVALRPRSSPTACDLEREEVDGPVENPDSPAAALGHSAALKWSVVAFGAAATVYWIQRRGLSRLDPNLMNFAFLFAGLAAHRSVMDYGRAVSDATRGCAGIILQFPFYAGIAALLDGLGIVSAVGRFFATVGPDLLPAATFFSAGLVNLFVPSGGGQWGVQGPLVLEAAVSSGVDPARAVMALAYGDQWTNMLQPFWALPLLAITGVQARDILGYGVAIFFVTQLLFLTGLYLPLW
ncbi:MAG: TIGR00366 family protein, partial [Myxococcota bacterium]